MYVCMYVCMYAYMYVCTYVRTYVCMCACRMYKHTYTRYKKNLNLKREVGIVASLATQPFINAELYMHATTKLCI